MTKSRDGIAKFQKMILKLEIGIEKVRKSEIRAIVRIGISNRKGSCAEVRVEKLARWSSSL